MITLKMNWKWISYLQVLLLSNLFPIYCVLSYNWPFFLIIWLYWLESVIGVVFEVSKLMISQKKIDPISDKAFFFNKLMLSFKMILFKYGILLFYLLFLIVFVALSGNSIDQMILTAKTIGFQNKLFNQAFINFIVTAYLQYIFYFLLNKKYLTTTPESHFNIFDVRTVLLHLVIVLGVFANQFLGNNPFENNNSGISKNYVFLIVFIMVKTFISISMASSLKKESENKMLI